MYADEGEKRYDGIYHKCHRKLRPDRDFSRDRTGIRLLSRAERIGAAPLGRGRGAGQVQLPRGVPAEHFGGAHRFLYLLCHRALWRCAAAAQD